MALALHVVAIGDRMPGWVDDGFEDYRKRVRDPFRLSLRALRMPAHTPRADLARVQAEEGERLLAAVPGGARMVALERSGRALDSLAIADRLRDWLTTCSDVAFLIGGPEGLDPGCLARADECWSLSALTLPHALARVLLAEQVFRACSIIQRHPYHR